MPTVGAYGQVSHRHAAHRSTRRGSGGYYTSADHHRVHRPVHAVSAPAGATAECYDGTFSFSRNHRGTCSHHGGVKRWL